MRAEYDHRVMLPIEALPHTLRSVIFARVLSLYFIDGVNKIHGGPGASRLARGTRRCRKAFCPHGLCFLAPPFELPYASSTGVVVVHARARNAESW